ncbi:MAG: SIS domain-containing protein [Streptosporangiaceae bacterium]
MSPVTAPRPLPVLPDQFLAQIEAAVDAGPALDAQLAALDPARFTSVFLVGCGGSLFTFAPLRCLLDRSPVPVFTFNSDELVLRRPARLGPGALVIVSSTRGATRETAAAARAARAAGASVIGVTQNPDSIVAAASEHVLLHQGVEAKQVILAQIGWSLLRAFGAASDEELDRAMTALRQSPPAFAQAHYEWDDQLAEMARLLHTEPVLYVLGSGPLEGAAQTLAMCYLQEMLKLNAAAISAGEFLHGPFEVITDEVPVILLKGDDVTRPMADRAERFLRQYTRKLWVLDAAALQLGSVDAPLRPLVGDLVLGSTVLNRIAEHFAALTGRRLTDRRYMWKIDY